MKRVFCKILIIFGISAIFSIGCEKTNTAEDRDDFNDTDSESDDEINEVIDNETETADNEDAEIVIDSDADTDVNAVQYNIKIILIKNNESELVTCKSGYYPTTSAKAGTVISVLADTDLNRFVLLNSSELNFSKTILIEDQISSYFTMPSKDVEITAIFKDIPDTDIIHVKPESSGEGNGFNWNNSMSNVQSAIELAYQLNIPEVWVAAGTYYPDSYPNYPDEKDTVHFSLRNNVAVRGGFNGTEKNLSERNLSENSTIFSGQGKTVVFLHTHYASLDHSAVLDGVTITDGANCFGGGMQNAGSPTILNSKFINNTTKISQYNCSGGGINNSGDSLLIVNSIFSGNIGAAIMNHYGSVIIINCTFFKNKGQALSNYYSSSFIVRNSIIYNNYGDEINFFNQNVEEGEVSNSLIEGGYHGNGNINDDPLFEDTTGDDPYKWNLQLKNNSPCIDHGYGSFLNEKELDADLDGNGFIVETTLSDLSDIKSNPRIFGKSVDMGAFEIQEAPDRPLYRITIVNINNQPEENILLNVNEAESYDQIKLTATLNSGRKVALSVTDATNSVKISYPILSNNKTAKFLMPKSDVVITAEYADYSIVFVKPDGSGNGSSWNKAAGDLQEAIETAAFSEINAVWVAAGTYSPTSWPNGRAGEDQKHFSLRNNVTVTGGFKGSESDIDERNVSENQTILFGGLHPSNGVNNLFFHPPSADLNETAVLDSVTLQGGRVSNQLLYPDGGAAICNNSSSSTIKNCTFIDNDAFGDGGSIHLVNASMIIENCHFEGSESYNGGTIYNDGLMDIKNSTFSENSTSGSGGAIYNAGTLRLDNCLFEKNETSSWGGAIYNSGAGVLRIINSSFIKNKAGYFGGAVYTYYDNNYLTAINSVFSENSSPNGGAFYYDGSQDFSCDKYSEIINNTFEKNLSSEGGTIAGYLQCLRIQNSILHGGGKEINPAIYETEYEYEAYLPFITYSLIENGFAGSGNIDGNPMFTNIIDEDPSNWDLRLKTTSPCIDAGNNDAFNETSIKADLNGDDDKNDDIYDFFDIINNSRLEGASVDMGAYELTPIN